MPVAAYLRWLIASLAMHTRPAPPANVPSTVEPSGKTSLSPICYGFAGGAQLESSCFSLRNVSSDSSWGAGGRTIDGGGSTTVFCDEDASSSSHTLSGSTISQQPVRLRRLAILSVIVICLGLFGFNCIHLSLWGSVSSRRRYVSGCTHFS